MFPDRVVNTQTVRIFTEILVYSSTRYRYASGGYCHGTAVPGIYSNMWVGATRLSIDAMPCGFRRVGAELCALTPLYSWHRTALQHRASPDPTQKFPHTNGLPQQREFQSVSLSVSQPSIPSHLRFVVEEYPPVRLVAEKGREFVAQVLFSDTASQRFLSIFVGGTCCSEEPLSLVDAVTHLHAVTKEAPHGTTSSPAWTAAFPTFASTAMLLRGWGGGRKLHNNADRVAGSLAPSLARLGVWLSCVLPGRVWLGKRGQGGEVRNDI